MSIPQSQLETWAKQGSVTQSASTYGSIKNALEHQSATYQNRNFKVFLQGSYGNDTNIYSESDVDVVIRYDGAFFHDLSELPSDQQTLFNSTFSNGDYSYNDFKNHVKDALDKVFQGDVIPGRKAIKVKANGSRRNVDVVPAFEFRRYFKFNGVSEYDQSYDLGICFFDKDGNRIVNYPTKHSDNSTVKHQETNSSFKPLVRIFKNIKTKLVQDGILEKDIAPSYFIEGLLYNVPKEMFRGSYQDMVGNILRWFQNTSDRSNFVCVNKQYYLLHENESICWHPNKMQEFMNAVQELWNNWR